jgi:DNA-binding NarL/FixJ family response regulator
MSHPFVVVVDDEPFMGRAVERSLLGRLDVRYFETADELLEHPGVIGEARAIVLDLGLSGTPGIELLRRLRTSEGRVPPIMVFTGHDDRETVASVMRWKPDGYVLKADAALSMGQAIQDVVTGWLPLSQAVARILIEIAAEVAARPDSPVCPVQVSFSAKEREVLRHLVESTAGNSAIATALKISIKTLETHITHIYEKLGLKDEPEARAKAIAKVRRLGLGLE